MEKKLGSLNTC